jgi:hypothetical protein
VLRVPAILPNGSPSNGGPIDLGFDQLGWVRMIRHTTGTRYEVVGMLRRRPRTCAISAATASALVGTGLPKVAAHCTGCPDCEH